MCACIIFPGINIQLMCIFTGFKEWHNVCFPCVSGLLPSDMSTQLALPKHLHIHMLGPEAKNCQRFFDIVLCYNVNNKCFISILWLNHPFLLKNGCKFSKRFWLFCPVDRDVKQHQASDFLLSMKHNKARSQSCFQGFRLVSHRFLLGSFVSLVCVVKHFLCLVLVSSSPLTFSASICWSVFLCLLCLIKLVLVVFSWLLPWGYWACNPWRLHACVTS